MEDDRRSVVTSRSRKSTRSTTTQASELRLKTAERITAAEEKLDVVVRSLRIAELELRSHQDEILACETTLEMLEEGSEAHKQHLEMLKNLKKEEKEFVKATELLKIDETLASNQLERLKKLSGLANQHADNIDGDESDHSQDLSGEEDGEDNESQSSVETERLRERLRRLRGSSPPPVKTPPQKEEDKMAGVSMSPTGVEQLAHVLSQALSKVNNASGPSNNNGEKMLARQAMKLELNPFDGNSAEWPVFYQQFNTVSAACGLTDVENLHRLQRSLRGEARESVRALLMSPGNVKKILSVLEKRFGNAEYIIQDLVLQVKKMPTVKEGDYRGLLKLVDAVRNLTETAVTMKCQPYLTNPQLINNIVDKLPAQFQVEWARKKNQLGSIYPDLQDVALWMESVGDVISHLCKPSTSTDSTMKKSTTFKPTSPEDQKSYAAVDTHKVQERKCRVCDSKAHHPSKCAKFMEMAVQDRWRSVRTNRSCFACLNFGHSVSECRGKKTCAIDGCDKSHHRLLHSQQRPDVQPTSSHRVDSEVSEVIGHVVAKGCINLNILPVTLTGPRGEIQTFAMLDPGASLTVIDAQVAEGLGLRGPTVPLTHSGLHAATTVSDSRSVEVKVSGGGSGGFPLKNVRTVPELTLPRQSVKRATLQKWRHLKKLPISVYADARPTILIGQDNVNLCNTSELVLGPANAPAAGRTKLGWVLMGRVGAYNQQNVMYHLREETEDDLHQLVKYHFSAESFGVKPNVEKPRSREDRRAVKILEDTLQRVGDKWECGLLRKEDFPQLPKNSKTTALKRLYSMERKMNADPEFAEDHFGKMTAYEEKGYARKLSPEETAEETNKTFYLPPFLAIKPKNNKRRFVLDAASKTSGSSLNDHMLAGLDLLTPLFKLRERKIGVMADVRDMFHRVGERKEVAIAQRLLWRGMNRMKKPDGYKMYPRIYGAKCSPTIAQFVQKLRKVKSLYLNPRDLEEAEKTWWRVVQQDCFAAELKCTMKKEKMPNDSKVKHLDLFVDGDGVMRLGGRLVNADVSDDTKFPVLLGTKHPYTRLLLSHHHEKGGHHGMERVVNEVRQKFFIPNLRAAVKSCWNRCQECSNKRAQPNPPIMGQLPPQRLEVGVFPFTNTGVDYFGPMEVTIGRRHEKRWGALFTCLSTRAVHLELAASLSTDSCLLAIRRFVGRRGCPRNLYSDNGTNFVGANNELQRALKDLEQEKIVSSCAGKGITWHFNPPSAPHMGGSWERLVKSVKVALHATLKERAPKEEVLQTLLVEAEHSVNSHPLTHVSIDPDDPKALTPNHFLIGRSSDVVPPGLFVESDLWGKKTWRKAQRLADSFWKRWVREYLPTLQRRTKWTKMTEEVKVGDVGVEVDPQQPRNEWKMGRVTAMFPGKDGVVRVVEWNTAAGSYRRPVAKLAFFDIRSEEKPVADVANNAPASLGVGVCDRPDEE